VTETTENNSFCSWENHKGEVVEKSGKFKVIDCESCGFKHIVPLPTVEELEETYKSEYYTKEKPLYVEKVAADLEWWKLGYRDRYEEFSRNLPETRRRLLDVGSGPGFFIQFGQENGWKVLGIEPSSLAAEHTRSLGLSVVEDLLDKKMVPELGRFDVVHLNNVLEHVRDPQEIIECCRKLLDDGGLICVGVPNDFNPFQKALQKSCKFKPWWVAPPHHINYFDFDSLEQLLIRNGFEIVVRETTFPIDMFLLMGDNYIGNDELGRICHKKRMAFEHNLEDAGQGEVRRQLYRQMAQLGLGREAVVMGRKINNHI